MLVATGSLTELPLSLDKIRVCIGTSLISGKWSAWIKDICSSDGVWVRRNSYDLDETNVQRSVLSPQVNGYQIMTEVQKSLSDDDTIIVADGHRLSSISESSLWNCRPCNNETYL